MPVEAPDLWPSQLTAVEVASPISILRRQAAVLGERTNYRLQGDVSTDAFNETCIHRFNITAPNLNRYTYELFAVRHDISFYPVTCMFQGHEVQAKTDKELMEWLRGAFASPHTIQVIDALLAQIEA
jgi:hypothetical protein